MRHRPRQSLGQAMPAGITTLMLLFGLLCGAITAQAADADTVNLGTGVPSADEIQQGLFPDDECERLKASGFKCMGFKPPVRFSMPSTAFKVGSAELPEGIKRQLDAFAAVLKGKTGSGRTVRIEGHADASGEPALNDALSQRRAEAARDYLVSKQVSPDLLKPVGLGSQAPVDPAQPLAPRNRRVVIARDQPPVSPASP